MRIFPLNFPDKTRAVGNTAYRTSSLCLLLIYHCSNFPTIICSAAANTKHGGGKKKIKALIKFIIVFRSCWQSLLVIEKAQSIGK